MRWASAASRLPDLESALAEAIAAVQAQLAGARPALVTVFVSVSHEPAYAKVPALIRPAFPGATLLGCSAGGVIGGGCEIEGVPAVSVTAAALPGVTVTPSRIAVDTIVPDAPAPRPAWILLADPFTFDSETFVRRLDAGGSAGVAIGGLASGGREPGQNALFLDDHVYPNGLVAVALTGNVIMDTIVAQGCRPVGQPMFVTRCEDNVLYDLDGRRSVVMLQALHDALPAADRELARRALFLGLVMDETRQQYGQGDFLIRNVLGIDPRRGALVVGATLRTGQVVQFHLRDAHTSREDLTHLLARYRQHPAGALLFSCLGRGEGLYGQTGHDSDAFHAAVGDVPLGGFFCNGEIGPVDGRTFLHGYTSAFGLFRPRETD